MTTQMTRREAVTALSALPLAGAFTLAPLDIERAWRALGDTRPGYAPKFFAAHEWETVRLLVDLIIPRDERSGSATDAGVPAFLDYVMAEREGDNRQTAMRGGLAWLDIECREQFGKESFVAATDAERRQVLDDIAYPDKAPERVSHGVRFFNMFRDVTAGGFFSSKMGVTDVQYIGNTFVVEWKGCPEEQLTKLGLR